MIHPPLSPVTPPNSLLPHFPTPFSLLPTPPIRPNSVQFDFQQSVLYNLQRTFHVGTEQNKEVC